MTGGGPIERSGAAVAVPGSADAELVERARRGDLRCFEMLVRARLDRIHRIARAILADEADAADATQETFVSAWRTIGRLRQPEQFDGWLRQIAINSCRQQLRRRARRSTREIAIEAEDVDAFGAVIAPHDERTIEAERFDRAFGCLSLEDRALLVLHHFDERSVADIANALGKPQGTIKSRLFRARAALESALAKEST